MPLWVASTVFAIAQPDTLGINEVSCYQSVLEDTDMLCMAHYEISYNTIPTETVETAFVAFFLTSSEAANSVAPFRYPGSLSGTSTAPYRGYGEGVLSFYWSANDVIDFGVPWEGANYQVVIQGNPSVFTSTIPQTIYTGVSFEDETQTIHLLGAKIREYARLLEDAWEDNNDSAGEPIDLLSTISGIQVLTTNGENYFLNAIPNLDLIAPDVFRSRVITPALIERDLDTSTAAGFASFFDNTFVATGTQAIASVFSISETLVRLGIWLVVMVAAGGYAMKRSGQPKVGFMVAFGAAFPLGMFIGFVPMALVLVTSLVMAAAATSVFLVRSG